MAPERIRVEKFQLLRQLTFRRMAWGDFSAVLSTVTAPNLADLFIHFHAPSVEVGSAAESLKSIDKALTLPIFQNLPRLHIQLPPKFPDPLSNTAKWMPNALERGILRLYYDDERIPTWEDDGKISTTLRLAMLS